MTPGASTKRERTLEHVVLAAITLLAVGLRLYRLDTDLWIDEIGSFQHATSVSVGELLRTFSSPNQHLLTSLLERAAVAVLGEHDWTIRLPAAFFGIATVPAMYWLARPVMGGWQRLVVAGFTAVSYHHVWFSQNARGYAGYLLFCVLATGALWRLVHDSRPRWIVAYACTALLALASLVIAAFVVITHVLLAVIVVLRLRRLGKPVAPLVRRLALAFGMTAVLSLAIYGPAAIELLRVVGTAYVREGTGFRPASLEFVAEVLRGLSAGFGPLALAGAVPFVAVAAAGAVSLGRRAPLIVFSFAIPLFLMALLVVAAGWLTSPRFFILVVPLAFILAVETLDLVAKVLSRFARAEAVRRRVRGALAAGAVAVCAAALSFGLPRYYAVPKQSYRAGIAAFLQRAHPGDALIAVYMADTGFDYYVGRMGLAGQHQFFSTRTAAGLDSLGAQLAGRRVVLATTLERAFKLEAPELWARVEAGWTPVETLPATVGYGEITLWEPRS